MIRSTTDEMLAARHDPEPYAGADGRRYANPFDMAVGVFAPRVEYIPSRDPKPWVNRNGDRYAHPRLTGAPLIFAPRVEYAHPEPNPILVELRKHWQPGFEEEEIQMALESTAGTPAQIEDARKVLTRLVEVFG